MKLEFTKEELEIIINGLHAGTDYCITMEEMDQYNVLRERIEGALQSKYEE